MFIHRLTFLNNSESSPTKASTAYLIPHLGFHYSALILSSAAPFEMQSMNYAGPFSSSQPPPLLQFTLQASPLALLSSHSLSKQPYPTGQRGLLITAVISLLATLHSPHPFSHFPSALLEWQITPHLYTQSSRRYAKLLTAIYRAVEKSRRKLAWIIKKWNLIKLNLFDFNLSKMSKNIPYFIQHMGFLSHKHEMWVYLHIAPYTHTHTHTHTHK